MDAFLNMPPSILELYLHLKTQLDLLEKEPRLKASDQGMTLSRETLLQVRERIIHTGFANDHEEIQFFKSVKPLFLTELIYFAELFRVELQRPATGAADQRLFLQKEVEAIKRELLRHSDFYKYYKSGATTLDPLLFRRGQARYPMPFLPLAMEHDLEFSTGYDYLAAYLLAIERLANEINQAFLLQWKGKVADLAELVYGFHATDVFGEKEVQKIADGIGNAFGVKFSKIHKTMEEIRLRKKERIPFLKALVEKTQTRMDQDDLGAR